MEIKKLNLEVIKLFEKLSKSLDETARNGKERVDILEHKIDHLISMIDHINHRTRILKIGEHPLSKKHTN